MAGMLAGATPVTGIVAAVAEADPTVQPVRQSFYVFLFLAVMLAILLFSFVRHLRRAQSLESGRSPEPALESSSEPGPRDDQLP